MRLRSTLGEAPAASWRDAVLSGLAPDGGLYMPEAIPRLSSDDLKRLEKMAFSDLAAELALQYLAQEVDRNTLASLCHNAFNFPLLSREVSAQTRVLELFHGPTCAFKDFGARFMAGLFKHFWGARGRRLTVLVATSGDTGSAVASAFHDASPDAPIRVVILFPKGKVSLVQERQMTTLGGNVSALEVSGTFDDCQRLVKCALSDANLASSTALTSANSINIARLLPQAFYYVFAALSLPGRTPAQVSVPSGNLGNLTGGLFARAMGVPFAGFISATNANDVFPAFLLSGSFSSRASVETISNAMDVGNPSNIARILSLHGGDVSRIRQSVVGEAVSEEETLEEMRLTYEDSGYILDPHTAVGMRALKRAQRHNSEHPGIVLATAHPAKFAAVVKRAIGFEPELPRQLAESLAKEGNKTAISADYSVLRSFLNEGA